MRGTQTEPVTHPPNPTLLTPSWDLVQEFRLSYHSRIIGIYSKTYGLGFRV